MKRGAKKRFCERARLQSCHERVLIGWRLQPLSRAGGSNEKDAKAGIWRRCFTARVNSCPFTGGASVAAFAMCAEQTAALLRKGTSLLVPHQAATRLCKPSPVGRGWTRERPGEGCFACSGGFIPPSARGAAARAALATHDPIQRSAGPGQKTFKTMAVISSFWGVCSANSLTASKTNRSNSSPECSLRCSHTCISRSTPNCARALLAASTTPSV